MGRARRGLPGTVAARRLVAGSVLLAIALLLLAPVARGVETSDRIVGGDPGLPVKVYVPEGAAPGGAPGVVIAHGFAGSAALMQTWSLALAQAGFVVVTPDLPGHGGNELPLADRSERLAEAVALAAEHLVTIPEVDVRRTASLGHSMGSGAVLKDGIARPDVVRAVVAVSPTDAEVSESLPRDLLLLAGANEARFVANAESLLERAGGPRGEPGDGDARRLVIVPRVEHVSILFSRAAHDTSIAWLADALDHQPTGRAPTGPLAGWSLLVLALVLLWQSLVVQAATPAPAPARRTAPLLALPIGGIAATASLVIVVRSVEVSDLVGVLVAGEVGLWFLMVGAIWLRFGIRPAAPEARDLGWALLSSAALIGIGSTFTIAWAPWWLTGVRPMAAVILALLLLPFALAATSVLHDRRGGQALVVWFVTSLAVFVTLGAAAVVVPGIGFLILVLPLLPLVLVVTTAIAVGVDRPWATAPAVAVFLGWLLAMLFPLA